MRRFLLTLGILFVLPLVALAQSSQNFTVTQQYESGDTTPPTTPGPLTATTTTYDQIFLDWGASTDNIVMGGYQVFRDALQIATTTLTTHTDTGLTPSTSYSYYVIAFDTDENYSTSSNIVTATTTGLPPTPPSDERPQGTVVFGLKSLSVEPNTTSVLITWETTWYARYSLRWGYTTNYELGYVSSDSAKLKQQTLITDLEPNTTYAFELVGYDVRGGETVLKSNRFKTLALPDAVAPPNISDLFAQVEQGDVILSWRNPAVDLDHVRVVRNPFFYPTDPNNGYVVYEGRAERFVDADPFESHDTLYYTVYTYDPSGNRSSGAIVAITKDGRVATVGSDNEEAVVATTPRSPDTSQVIKLPLNLSLDEVVIIQDEFIIRPVSGFFTFDTTLPFIVQAPLDLFPKHLKAIRLTLTHPVDSARAQSYLLRINEDGTAYEATVNGLEYGGTIPLELTVYDYETKEAATARGFIVSLESKPELGDVISVISWYQDIWWLIALILLVVLALLFGRRFFRHS